MTYSVDPSLIVSLKQLLPAVDTAGCCFSPVAGLSGESWRIQTPQGEYLARRQTREMAEMGVSRRRELRMLRCQRQGAVGPPPLGLHGDWLLVAWIGGEPLPDAAFGPDGALAPLLVRLHRQPRGGSPLVLKAALARSGQQIDRTRLTPRWLRYHQALLRAPLPPVLKIAPLHMDIHAGNIIVTGGGWRLIDWEYAADGDIACELAALVRGNGWSAQQQAALVAAYCAAGGYGDAGRLHTAVTRWLPWIDYLMLMWYEVRWQQTHTISFRAAADGLHARLQSR
ncbi:phosphotransferase [Chimaeribacter arupi]|uniref:phosphotransferase n=1 Tax=Chimaeribacter arupi TaxID=2060066 RepID=UPI002711E5BA|nr:phosphotransferase [Chimaeribacter arupi]WKZ91025.1 phosphotransferase [Chimaeribacter arupi]